MERAANLLKVGAKISRVRLTRHHPSRSKRRRARLPSFAMMRVVLSASADARALTVSPSSRRATRGSSRSLERRVRLRFSNEQASLAPVRAPPRFRARLPPVRASDSYADETDDALEVFGFSEAWEVEMLVELGAADADVAAQARASNSPPLQPWSPPAPAPV